MSDAQESADHSTPANGWYLYLVRCRNGTLYTGITTDVERRFAEHQEGGQKAARYLRGKGPLELVYTMGAGNRALASTLEYRVKRLTRADKQSLIAGTLDRSILHLSADSSTDLDMLGRTTKDGTET